ncbi:MAG: CoA transferase [Acidobacteria bacterium]|nr:CoA transferase [Acidobacteriota bacterium]
MNSLSGLGALTGIKVLDLSRVLAGPFCTQILGDLGADVIKVERPKVGDDTRYWGPPFTQDKTAAYFTCTNRNKRDITVNLKSEKGREIITKLAKQSDVFIENYKTGELANFGLDYQTLVKVNPRLIYCSITGFGQTGIRKDEAGYDFLIQAMGGLMSITGNETDPDGGMKVGVALVDLFTGLWATVAILAALESRNKTGQGQYIDLALFDCQLSMLANVASNWLISGKKPRRFGNAHPNLVPYQTFMAKDGAFALAIGNDKQFRLLCENLGHIEIAEDFPTNASRVENRSKCTEKLQEIFSQKPKEEIIFLCKKLDIPAGSINTVDQAFQDPQTIDRNMVIELVNKRGEKIPTVASPIKMSRTPIEYRFAPPQLGENNREVLEELGYSKEIIQEFIEQKII